MNLVLKRKRNNGDTTIGNLRDSFISMSSLEDEPREVKVKGETRIPAGTYEILERKVESPKTIKYRNRYPWFKWHLELQDVPNFKYVYIHIGNKDEDTDGCILVAEEETEDRIQRSTEAFIRLYHYIMGAINSGQRVFISIIDEDGK